ncbi:hypothetical protein BCR42DRAFT_385804 [Absidia repens]|uniref:Uncharacterized protein n=1 Tax=Absidia repens TaxID=90262 RepID=A0A1X2IZZ0_9FUNG|nr:hypothetical protein BCR42DRAFT_385804 [Absidia repens]
MTILPILRARSSCQSPLTGPAAPHLQPALWYSYFKKLPCLSNGKSILDQTQLYQKTRYKLHRIMATWIREEHYNPKCELLAVTFRTDHMQKVNRLDHGSLISIIFNILYALFGTWVFVVALEIFHLLCVSRWRFCLYQNKQDSKLGNIMVSGFLF